MKDHLISLAIGLLAIGLIALFAYAMSALLLIRATVFVIAALALSYIFGVAIRSVISDR